MKIRQETVNEFSKIYNEYNNEEGLKMRQAVKKAIFKLPQYNYSQKCFIWKTILARADKDLGAKIK